MSNTKEPWPCQPSCESEIGDMQTSCGNRNSLGIQKGISDTNESWVYETMNLISDYRSDDENLSGFEDNQVSPKDENPSVYPNEHRTLNNIQEEQKRSFSCSIEQSWEDTNDETEDRTSGYTRTKNSVGFPYVRMHESDCSSGEVSSGDETKSEDIVEFPLVRRDVGHIPRSVRGDSDDDLSRGDLNLASYGFKGNNTVTSNSLGMKTFNFTRLASGLKDQSQQNLKFYYNQEAPTCRRSFFHSDTEEDMLNNFSILKQRYKILHKYYKIEGDHGVGLFLCYREHSMDLRTHCCSGKMVLGVSSAHLRDDVYAILCTYQHMAIRVLNCSKVTLDVMGPIGLYSTPFTLQHYLHYFTDLKKLLTEADTKNLVFGTDGNQTLREALAQVFPQCRLLVCNFTLNRTFRKSLADSTALSEGEIENFARAYMGIARFDDKDSSENHVQRLQECCRESCPEFEDLFTNFYLPLILPNQGGYHSWENCLPEADIGDVKNMVQYTRNIVEILTILTVRVRASFGTIYKAITSTELELTPPYRSFKYSKDVWVNSLSLEEKVVWFYELMTYYF